MNECMLSIYVATYNHENYIVKALDSIFMQNTQYSYEVLVGEDCSTDATRKVLQQYEKEHMEYVQNGCLKIFYRDHNMYHETPSNATDLKMKCRGKYIIALEGDDYWIDCNKIESQIGFLEKHPEYIAVAHNCVVVDENNEPQKKVEYPECKEENYTFTHFMSNILPGQLTTVMYRNIYLNKKIDTSLLDKELIPGDRLIYLTLLLNGGIYCIQKKMSAYRFVTSHGFSHSATYKYDFKNEINWHLEVLKYIKTNKSSYTKYGEALCMRCILRGFRERQCTLKEVKLYTWQLEYKAYAFLKWIEYKLRKDILKTKKLM